jgi:hypothetical protein
MFRGPLLHLGPGLFPRQLALEHLGANGLALGAELLDEGLLFGGGVGAESGTHAGAHAHTPARSETGAIAGDEASASTGAETGTLAGGKARPGTGTDTSVCTGAEALTRTGEGAPLTYETAALANALRHPHASGALQGKAAHLLLMLYAQCLTTGEVVDARECPGLQATLRESRYCGRDQSHGKTKELDGAHLRLPMSVGDWTAPFAQWTLGYGRC